MNEIFYGASISGIIIGVVKVFQKSGLPTRYLPLASVILGLLAGFLLLSDFKEAIIFGLAMGLSASGLYDLSKITILGK